MEGSESLGERGGPEQGGEWDGQRGRAGATRPRKYLRASTLGEYVTVYGSFYRGKLVRRIVEGRDGSLNSFLEHTASGTVGTGD